MGRKSRKRDAGLPAELIKDIVKSVGNMHTVADIDDELVVPTLFTSLNRATGVGGWPLRRMGIVHGQNQTGKSVIAMGIAESLRRMGHIPVVFDTEHSAERRWYNELACGPCTPFKMPENLDEVIGDVTSLLKNLADRQAGRGAEAKLLRGSGFCFVVDTMTKLIPKDALEALRKEGPKRGYSIASLFVSIWMKSLIPQLYRANSTMICVVQERENIDRKSPREKKHKVSGGQAIQYDASLRIQTTYAKKVEESKRVVGYENHYRLIKNKVDGVEMAEGVFFTSNGKGRAPKGYDSVREAVTEARFRGLASAGKRKGKSVIKVSIPVGDDEHAMTVKGGWADLRDELYGDEMLLDAFVRALDANAAQEQPS